jgi:hypothetical protein
VLGLLHHMVVGNVSDISQVHDASVFNAFDRQGGGSMYL